ncbi:MAG: class I adenylate-forming enzyme family protein [Micrococcales bacterium]
MNTILEQIEAAALGHPDSIAIARGGESLTYSQLWRSVESVSAAALRWGAKPGDRFIFGARPSPRSIAYALGLLRAGLTLVFVDPFSAQELFNSRVEMVQPRLVVADSLLYAIGSRWLAWLRRARRINVCDYGRLGGVQHLYLGPRLPGVPLRAKSLAAWAGSAKPAGAPAEMQPNPGADAIVTFTSGTTGQPKGVVHTLASISANVVNFADRFGIAPGSLVYAEPMTLGVVALTRGATWRIPVESEALPQGIDVLFAVPADLAKILRKAGAGSQRPAVRVVGTGAAPVLPPLIEDIAATFGEATEIVNVYGMTEMLPIATCDARSKLEHIRSGGRGDLVGQPMGDTKIRLASDGEIEVSGSGLMNRYFGRSPESWHPTGDLGTIRADGQLVLLGRKKNMLIRGNMNIYPSLYEPGICTIPGVADAAIVGVPDRIGDDRVMLFVVAKPGFDPSRVLDAVRSQVHLHMDEDARPDMVELLDSMPLSGRSLKRDSLVLTQLARARFQAGGLL